MHKNSMKLWMIECISRGINPAVVCKNRNIYTGIFSKNQLLNLIEDSHSSQTAKSEHEQLISTPNPH